MMKVMEMVMYWGWKTGWGWEKVEVRPSPALAQYAVLEPGQGGRAVDNKRRTVGCLRHTAAIGRRVFLRQRSTCWG
jgi:hypothetical protein